MSYYDYDESDFYPEPSEFEQQIDEFKESLKESVKKDFIDEMNRLRKENEELQGVKKNMENLESNHRDTLGKLNRERQDLEYKVRRERLSSLIGEMEYFTIAHRNKSKPKCEKCDENRRIPYKTPSGKQAYEYCECNESIHIYEPIGMMLVELSLRNGEGNAWYKVKDRGRDEYLNYYEDSIHGSKLITDEKQFEGLSTYNPLFQTKELAQKFCELKNKKREEK